MFSLKDYRYRASPAVLGMQRARVCRLPNARTAKFLILFVAQAPK
jgi:hypothetical protein